MKITKEEIKIGIGVLALVIGIILVISIFTGFHKKDPPVNEQVIAAKDETIAVLKEQRTHLLEDNQKSDETIRLLEDRDSALQQHYLQNQIIYKQLDAQLKNIPADIARIAHNDDSIRAAFARHD